jgi:regulator of sigma E protease
MIDIIWNFASFIVALGILVTVHEFGHFWVARKCGVKVEKFSIGFGKSLWNRIGADGTEYSVSAIPLGGYVKMLDGRVDDVAEEMQQYAFDRKPLWQRTAVVAAGPAFNFVFAVFAYWLVFLIGVPTVKPIIGEVTPSSIVAQAGVESGMELTSISGVKTADWESVNMRLVSHIGDSEMVMTLIPAGGYGIEETKRLDLSDWKYDPETESAMQTLGFVPFRPEIFTSIAHVAEESAAEKAGVQVGDKIVSIDGTEISKWQQVVELVSAAPNQLLEIQVDRNGSTTKLELIPDSRKSADGSEIGFAGMGPESAEWPQDYRLEIQYGVFESVGKAVDKTKQVVILTFSMLKKLIVGDVGLNNLSGPISIAKGAGTTADYGLVYFLGFLALISVNLGIINLMPLPILDGGHLLFYAIEAIIRKPVPEKVQEMGFRVGGAIIFSLMAIAVFNDFMRL